MIKLRKDFNDLLKDKALIGQKAELIALQLKESEEKVTYYRNNYDNLLSNLGKD